MAREEREHPGVGEFTHRVAVVIAFVFATLILLLVAWQAFTVLLLVFASVLLGLVLAWLTDLTAEHTRLPRTAALVVVVLVLLALTAGAVTLLAPIVEEQAVRLGEQLPSALDTLEAYLEQSRLGRQLLEEARNLPTKLGSAVALDRMAGILSSAVGVLGGVFFVGILGVYLAAEPELYVDGVLRLLPPARRQRMREVLSEMARVLLRWLAGQLISMVILGVLTTVTLHLLGVPLALILGLLVAVMTFIPVLGPILASVPILLLALTKGLSTFLLVALVYAGIQQLEGNLITPLVHRARIDLPPVLILAVQLVLARLVGFVGILMAMPLVAAGMVAVRMLYVEDVLGDRPDEPE